MTKLSPRKHVIMVLEISNILKDACKLSQRFGGCKS